MSDEDNDVVGERLLFSSIRNMELRKIYSSQSFLHYSDRVLIKAPPVCVKSLCFDINDRLSEVELCAEDRRLLSNETESESTGKTRISNKW